MDDREFFDKLFQLWSKTTGAENHYWSYQGYGDRFDVDAVGVGGERIEVASLFNEADADFITAIHGCLPDLVRRLHAALDEADALDAEMDRVQSQLMEAELRVDELRQQVKDYESDLEGFINA